MSVDKFLNKASKKTENYILCDLYYIEGENSNIIIYDDVIDKNINYNKVSVYIKNPHWTDIYEVRRKSSRKHPYHRNETILDQFKFKKNKILFLCKKIVDKNDVVFKITKDNIEDLDPDFCNFILKMIDKYIELNFDEGLDKEEGDSLASDCYKFFRAQKRQSLGHKEHIPEPPYIVVLYNICKIMNCTIEEARNIPKKDIDALFIMNEQKNICQDPSAVGIDVNKYKNQFRNRTNQSKTTIYTGNSIINQ